jgi:hypothetical protein
LIPQQFRQRELGAVLQREWLNLPESSE